MSLPVNVDMTSGNFVIQFAKTRHRPRRAFTKSRGAVG